MRQEALSAEIADSSRKLLPMHTVSSKSENGDGRALLVPFAYLLTYSPTHSGSAMAMPLRVTGNAMSRLTSFTSKNHTQFNPLAKQDHALEVLIDLAPTHSFPHAFPHSFPHSPA